MAKVFSLNSGNGQRGVKQPIRPTPPVRPAPGEGWQNEPVYIGGPGPPKILPLTAVTSGFVPEQIALDTKLRHSTGDNTAREGQLIILRRGNRVLRMRQPAGVNPAVKARFDATK